MTQPQDIPIQFSPSALKLWEETNNQWALDGPATMLLRLACESITRAESAAEIVNKEGQCVPDRFGIPRKHPATLIEQDARAAAANAIQKLTLSLGHN